MASNSVASLRNRLRTTPSPVLLHVVSCNPPREFWEFVGSEVHWFFMAEQLLSLRTHHLSQPRVQADFHWKRISGLLLAAVFGLAGAGVAAPRHGAGRTTDNAAKSPLIAAMQAELERSKAAFGKLDPPAYFLGYTLTDTQRAEVSGSNGALLSSLEVRNRWMEVEVRTGSYDLDDTRKVGERQRPASGAPRGARAAAHQAGAILLRP